MSIIPKPVKYTVFCLLAILLTARANAQSLAEVFEPLITERVVAVAYADLSKTDVAGLSREIERRLAEPLGFDLPDMNEAHQKIQELRELGLSRIYLTFRLSDIQAGFPLIVMRVEQNKDPKAALKFLETEFQLPLSEIEFKIRDSTIYLGAAGQLDRLLDEKPEKKRDLSSGFEAIDEASVGLLIFGDSDSRRVVRELLGNFEFPLNKLAAARGQPEMPVEFPKISGELIADEVNWMATRIDVSQQASLKFAFDAKTDAAASAVNEFLSGTISSLLRIAESEIPKEIIEFAAAYLKPKLVGRRSVIELNLQQFDNVAALLLPGVKAMRSTAQRTTERNRLRQLALGMLNYESVHGHFPDPAGSQVDGTPGLSWRVHILPILDEGELYDKFNLDEAWDSEHNLALIDQMPDAFKSPLAKGVEDNKTIFQIPISATSAFRPGEELKITDVSDGTSNTLLIVTTAPTKAVIWTKPQDWNVDAKNPWKGLAREERDVIQAVRIDASTFVLPKTLSSENLQALITRDGEEVIPRHELR